MVQKVLITGIHERLSSWPKVARVRFLGRHAYVDISAHMDAGGFFDPKGKFACGEVNFVKKGVSMIGPICIYGFTYKIIKSGRSRSKCLSQKQMPLL